MARFPLSRLVLPIAFALGLGGCVYGPGYGHGHGGGYYAAPQARYYGGSGGGYGHYDRPYHRPYRGW